MGRERQGPVMRLWASLWFTLITVGAIGWTMMLVEWTEGSPSRGSLLLVAIVFVWYFRLTIYAESAAAGQGDTDG